MRRHLATSGACTLADDLSGRAASALDGSSLYARFETVLDGLDLLGFFPDSILAAAVARSMIGPARRPDKLAQSAG